MVLFSLIEHGISVYRCVIIPYPCPFVILGVSLFLMTLHLVQIVRNGCKKYWYCTIHARNNELKDFQET